MSSKNIRNSRVVGGFSLHEQENSELCKGRHANWRIVDCCTIEEDRDILECSRCGKQISARCNFDDDMS